MSQRQRTSNSSHGQGHGHQNESEHTMPKWLPQIVFAVVVYSFALTFAGAWWASSQSSAQTASKDSITSLQTDVRALQAKNDRLAVLETKLESISKTLEKMEAALSRQHMRGKS